MCPLCLKNFVNHSVCFIFPAIVPTLLCSHTVTCHWWQLSWPPGGNIRVTWPDLCLTRSPICHSLKTLADNLVTSFIPPSFPLSSSSHLRPFLSPFRSPLLISLSGSNHLKTTIISETSVVGNQLTFTSSLSPRPRTWTWLRKWSAWCWKSSTLACATLYTTTPTWCTRCSTRGSSLSSSGLTHPSRTSCRTWTRSVGFAPDRRPNIRSELKEAWTLKCFCLVLW